MRFDRTFWFLALLFCASFVLGTIGFREHQDLPWSTAAYKAVQLFNTNSGALDEKRSPPTLILEIARWAALLFTLGAFASVVAALFHGAKTWLRLGFGRRHDIVCGGGEKGASLAADLISKGVKVAVIDVDAGEPGLEPLKKAGAIVICGDARHASVLKKAHVCSARRLVCAAGEDSVNLSIAMAAANASAGRAKPLDIRVHIGDVGHRDLLQRNKVLGSGQDRGFEVKTFNFFRNKARKTLQMNPLELDNDRVLCDEVHIVLPGLARFETALAVQTALVGHYRHGGKCTIHIVCADPAKDTAQLLKRYPHFEKCCSLQQHALGESGDLIPKAAEIIGRLPEEAFCTVFLCTGDEGALFTEALLLKDLLPNNDRFRVVLSPKPDSFLGEMLGKNSGQHNPLARWIAFAASNSEACGCGAVYGEKLDRLARGIHEVWYAKNAANVHDAEARGDKEAAHKLRRKETFRPWDELSESQKDVNRFAADHVEVKVRAAGLSPRDEDRLESGWRNLGPSVLEMLSRAEHERWSAAMHISGWMFGNERHEEKRHHPDLVPYEDLGEATKDYDRDQVRAAAGHLVAFSKKARG